VSIEAMKQALEALRFALHVGFDESSESQIKKGDKAFRQHQDAIPTLRLAIEQAEKQEPTPAMIQALTEQYDSDRAIGIGFNPQTLCRAVLAVQRQPLTDEQVRDLWSWSATAEAERTATTQQHAFARAIERAHGIGGKHD